MRVHRLRELWASSSGVVVYVTAVSDAKHSDCVPFVVDPVDDPVGAASGSEKAGEFVAEFSPDPMRCFDQRPSEELDHRGGDAFRKILGDRAGSGTGDDELVVSQDAR